ncbi:hypothetical protein HYV30_03865 [Candidatus Kaiserbacteria bacterium]|nr:hypothetical protein [Candidatus Kaiserbacteria bacterium]
MSDLQVKAVLAGLFFGIWPLFMNKSGLQGNVSSLVFGLAATLGVMPFALQSIGFTLPSANWLMVVCAGVFGALGLLSFNGMLASAPAEKVGALFVTMIVVQIMVPAIYQIYMAGQLPMTKVAGFVLAIAAAFLLI